jgi:outer membrane protein OmpU
MMARRKGGGIGAATALVSAVVTPALTLVSAPALAPAMADEEPIRIWINGDIQQWAVAAGQDIDTGDGADIGTSPFDQKHNSDLTFHGETVLDGGLTIGLRVEMEANTDESQITESYLYVENRYGLVQIGDTDSSPINMHVGAPDGGVSVNDGDLVGIEAFVLPEGFDEGNTLIDSTYLQLGDDASGKFSYYTPRIGGVQLGISYIPRFEDGGNDNNSIDRVDGEGPTTDGVAVGVNLEQEWDEADVEAYAGYLFGDTAPADGSTNVQGAGAGLVIGVSGVEVGGSVAWATGDRPDDESFDGYSFDLGIAYETGLYQIGLTYIRGVSEGARDDSGNQRLDQAVLGGTITLGDGVDLVGALFYYAADGEKALVTGTNGVAANHGYGLATGLKVTF